MQFGNSVDDEILTMLVERAEVAYLDAQIAQLTQERAVVDSHFRPSTVIETEIASTEDERAKKKIEIENMRGQEKRSTQKKYDERVAVAQAELSKAKKDMQREFLITDNKFNAMLRRSDVVLERTLSNLKSEYDETHGRELQPGTPENTRKMFNADKDEELLAKKTLKRKFSFKPASITVYMSEPDNI